jgi:hypothetical protein
MVTTDDKRDASAGRETNSYDWNALVDDLNRLLRLRTTPIGMKLFATVEEMEAIAKIRRPKSIHTTDQIVAQAARLGWTVGITAKDLVGAQARIANAAEYRACRAQTGCGTQGALRSSDRNSARDRAERKAWSIEGNPAAPAPFGRPEPGVQRAPEIGSETHR